MDHKDKPPKDLKEPKSAFRDSGWEPSKAPKEPSRKPKENQPLRDINPKMGFKEPKSLSKEHRIEGMTHGAGLNKRLSAPDCDDHMTKKRKKGFVDSSGKQTSGIDTQHLDKKLLKDRSQMRMSKLQSDGDEAECRKVTTLPPFQELVGHNDSDVEDQSTKSDVSRHILVLLGHYTNTETDLSYDTITPGQPMSLYYPRVLNSSYFHRLLI
uniref:Uncharacterized protein n=1 Tax=Acanthochromis polyacanthus TaxID=80966 RepID=A0A3Q1ESQ4_9TELE